MSSSVSLTRPGSTAPIAASGGAQAVASAAADRAPESAPRDGFEPSSGTVTTAPRQQALPELRNGTPTRGLQASASGAPTTRSTAEAIVARVESELSSGHLHDRGTLTVKADASTTKADGPDAGIPDKVSGSVAVGYTSPHGFSMSLNASQTQVRGQQTDTSVGLEVKIPLGGATDGVGAKKDGVRDQMRSNDSGFQSFINNAMAEGSSPDARLMALGQALDTSMETTRAAVVKGVDQGVLHDMKPEIVADLASELRQIRIAGSQVLKDVEPGKRDALLQAHFEDAPELIALLKQG